VTLISEFSTQYPILLLSITLFSTHPKIDPRNGDLVTYGYNVTSKPHCSVSLITKEGELVHTTGVDIPKPVMMHDCAITSNHTILMDLPCVFDFARIAEGKIMLYFELENGSHFGIHAWLDNNPQADVQPLEVMLADDADLVLAGLPVAMNTEIQDPLQPAHTLLLAITLLSELFLGTSVTSVALTYTGAYPVNLLLLLAILVGLPGLTLMLSIIARLFGRKQSPSFGAVLTWSLGRLNQDHADLSVCRICYFSISDYFYRHSIRLE
jgi:hypothetical protein